MWSNTKLEQQGADWLLVCGGEVLEAFPRLRVLSVARQVDTQRWWCLHRREACQAYDMRILCEAPMQRYPRC
jgi:hypothetical protein